MRPYRKRAITFAVQMPDDFVIVQNADNAEIVGEIVARAGSWLARGRDGVYYPISDETFRGSYEEISDESLSESLSLTSPTDTSRRSPFTDETRSANG